MSMRQIQEKNLYSYNSNAFRFRQSTVDFQSQNAQQSDDSEQQQKKQQIIRREVAKRQWNKIDNKRDFVVNGGFNFDITDYFKFQQKDQKNREHTFFKYLSQKNYLPWIILFYSVCSSAMIPPWLMSIAANKILRISWRCLLHLCILIPFVFFQYRTADAKKRQMYTLKHIFYPKHFRKLCIAAFQATFFASLVLSSIEWTYIAHSFVLASLPNFFLSIQRTINGNNGHMQRGGQIMIVLGIIMVIYDSYALVVQNASKAHWNVYNSFYLTRQWWQRILADLAALSVAYVTSQLSKKTSDLKQYYPPYLSMFLNNIMISLFTITSAYFFNGATFDFNSKFGIFGLFTQQHFTNFLYMSIVLGFGVFVSLVMVSKLFTDPIVPALAMTLQPIISTVLFQLVGVQMMPSAYACMGFILIIPGLMVILIGNCLFTRENNSFQIIQKIAASKSLLQYNKTIKRKPQIQMQQIQPLKQEYDRVMQQILEEPHYPKLKGSKK